MKPELSFIIVNWNGGELLRRCLASVAAHPPSVPHEVVVVDNASSDGSVEWLRSEELSGRVGAAPLRVIENAGNLGFGKANNQGFAASDAPLLFLLNSDAELRAGACDALVKTLRSDPRAGACGPRLVNPDGSLQTSVWRNPPAAWSTLVEGLRLYLLLPRRLRGELLLDRFWAHDRRRAVPMLGGAALLVRRELIDDVGGFDERFHMYGEDNEWCLRMVRGGWRLLFEPGAEVMHHGGQSSVRRWSDMEKMRVQLEAFFDFQRRCLPRRSALANLLASASLLSMQRTWRSLRGRPAAEVELSLRLHVADLRRTLREWHTPHSSEK